LLLANNSSSGSNGRGMVRIHRFRSARASSNNSSFRFAVTTVRFKEDGNDDDEEEEGTGVKGLFALAFAFAALIGVAGGTDAETESVVIVDTEDAIVVCFPLLFIFLLNSAATAAIDLSVGNRIRAGSCSFLLIQLPFVWIDGWMGWMDGWIQKGLCRHRY